MTYKQQAVLLLNGSTPVEVADYDLSRLCGRLRQRRTRSFKPIWIRRQDGVPTAAYKIGFHDDGSIAWDTLFRAIQGLCLREDRDWFALWTSTDMPEDHLSPYLAEAQTDDMSTFDLEEAEKWYHRFMTDSDSSIEVVSAVLEVALKDGIHPTHVFDHWEPEQFYRIRKCLFSDSGPIPDTERFLWRGRLIGPHTSHDGG